MTELIARMKTACFGRYIVEIPAAADFTVGNAEADDIKVEHTLPYVDESDYRDRLDLREKLLRSTSHETESSLLRSVIRTKEGRQAIFLSRTDSRDKRTILVESFVFNPSYRLSRVAAQETLEERTNLITQLSRRISPRDNTTIPQTPGACIADGLLDFTPQYNERFTAAATMTSPAWIISFSTANDGPSDPGKDLHARADQAIEMIGPAGSTIRKLRRGFVTVDGRKGREYLGIFPADRNGPTETFDAKLEVEGNGEPKQTNIKLHMEAVWPKMRDPADAGKYLTQEEALSLWDAVVKSVRMRPGAF